MTEAKPPTEDVPTPPDEDEAPPPPIGAPPAEDESGDDGGPPPPPPPDEEGPPPPPPPAPPEKKAISPRAGRLRVALLEARDITAHNALGMKQPGQKVDPYIKIKLGSDKKAPVKKGKIHKKQKNAFSLEEEVIDFDIVDPMNHMSKNGDEDEIPLTIQIWDNNRFSDDLMGEITISVLDFMEMQDERYGMLNESKSLEWWPLSFTSKQGTQPAGELRLQIEFLPAWEGLLVITCYEGRNLKNMELIGKQDPYCKFTLGTAKQRTKTVKAGGTNPYFNEEECEFWIGKDSWTDALVFSCFDEDIGSDDLIGGRRFSLLPLFCKREPMHDWFEISNKGKKAGEVQLKLEFFPAGRLKINCHAGRNLIDSDSFGRQDPYVFFRLNTPISKQEVRTKTDTDGGTEPVFEEIFYLPVVHQYELVIDVMDEDMIGSDDVIGRAAVSLLPVYKNGFADQWIPLGIKDKWGKRIGAGELHVEFDFVGVPGIAYPQRRPEIDSFDDSNRRDRDAEKAKEQEELDNAHEDFHKELGSETRADKPDTPGAPGETTPEEEKPTRPPGSSMEFTDQEIKDAFTFLDLDKNGFIGAAEIRHILICMGELITDEEVDEMIRMVDTDGDGQVSFQEFFLLVVHPDPGAPDFNPEKMKEHAAPPPPDGSSKIQVAEAKMSAAERGKLMALKQEKKKLLGQFAEENRVRATFIRETYDRWRKLCRDSKELGDDEVTFDEWIRCARVEPTGENKELFRLYDAADGVAHGTIDMREFLLGINNFSGESRENKVTFTFKLYDEDNNGFLVEEELVKILRATHMATDDKQVLKKAKTILRQVDKDGDGKVSREEFAVVAEKFPNILFPNMGRSKAD